MPTTLQFRRGTTAQNNAFTGSAGELSIDEQLDVIRVHDGSTAGGAMELTGNTASQTLTNKTLTSPQINTQIDMLARAEMRFQDATGGEYVALEAPATVSSSLTFTLPDADGTSGQAIVTDGSGALSFAAAGATISSDTSTDTDFLVYFASTTSGALTAVKQDSGLTYNPSTGSITSATFIGALTGNASGSAATLATARAIALSGDVVGTANFDGSAGISISTTIQANSVALGTDTTGNYVAAGATSGSGISGSVSSEGGTFTVTSNATNANTGSTIVFRDGSGNFSAGTITATATTAQYADLAEKYLADNTYQPGTVLQFGGQNEVTETKKPNSVAIAGVVSTNPAHLMNSELYGEFVVELALLGRVPCNVVGKVNKGDLLVSSDVPGYACAYKEDNNPPAGSVIGKSIEEKHDTEQGIIEVLVGRL